MGTNFGSGESYQSSKLPRKLIGDTPRTKKGTKMGSVTLTDATHKALVADITEAVVKRAGEETLEALRQTVRLEATVARLTEELVRKDAHITDLTNRINQLSAFLVPSAQTYQQPPMTALTGPATPVPPTLYPTQFGAYAPTQPVAPAAETVSNGHGATG